MKIILYLSRGCDLVKKTLMGVRRGWAALFWAAAAALLEMFLKVTFWMFSCKERFGVLHVQIKL